MTPSAEARCWNKPKLIKNRESNRTKKRIVAFISLSLSLSRGTICRKEESGSYSTVPLSYVGFTVVDPYASNCSVLAGAPAGLHHFFPPLLSHGLPLLLLGAQDLINCRSPPSMFALFTFAPIFHVREVTCPFLSFLFLVCQSIRASTYRTVNWLSSTSLLSQAQPPRIRDMVVDRGEER